MVIGDQCAFIDGLCRCYHGVAYADGAGTPAHTLHSFDTTSGPHGCHMLLGDADPGVPCAACRLAELEALGVGIGKMGGRGTPLSERIGRLSFLRQAQALGTPQDIRALYAQRFGTPCRCYYPQ